MKKFSVLLGMTLFFCSTTWAQSTCFLVQENQTVLKQEGTDCKQRFAPESTFKIALSLMGFDSGILKDELHPEWPYKKEYELYLNVWKYPHNPLTWIRDSCVWYSQVLTQQLGMTRFKSYVDAFHYGNQDVSGDKGQNNGLTHAWLSSSLAISPREQIQFLQKIINKKLPVSQKAFTMTKDILYIQELAGGWKLYGKTGTGKQLTKKHGWFVGWIEKDNRRITFANHIIGCKETHAGLKARNEVLIKLFYLINELVVDWSHYPEPDNNPFITTNRIKLYDKNRKRLIPVNTYVSNESLGKAKAGILKLPVVIINHGYTALNTEYSFLANALAANGYFVVSIQHDLKSDPPLARTGNLFERRKPLWERGSANILYLIKELNHINSNLNLSKVTLIGHSNGGDIAMLFASNHPKLVEKIISLDSLRMPFPRTGRIPILSLRGNDTRADEGVLPPEELLNQLAITIIPLPEAKHIDLCDRGSAVIQQQIKALIFKFLRG